MVNDIFIKLNNLTVTLMYILHSNTRSHLDCEVDALTMLVLAVVLAVTFIGKVCDFLSTMKQSESLHTNDAVHSNA